MLYSRLLSPFIAATLAIHPAAAQNHESDSKMLACADEINALTPIPALEYIEASLETNRIVFLGERHSTRSLHDLYNEIINSPIITSKIDDIFVEFLSSFHQETLDRYLLELKPMTFEEIAPTWRDVPGIILHDGDNTAAYEFIESVRNVNETLKESERIRVLAGDSYLDWSKVSRQRDWATALNRRDRRFLEVLWDEVIDRNRKAIAILGRGHVKRLDPTPPNWITLVELIEKREPGQSHLIHFMYPELAEVEWEAPSILGVKDTCIADLRLETGHTDIRYGDQVDAVLFTGQSVETIPAQPYPDAFNKVMESRNKRIE